MKSEGYFIPHCDNEYCDLGAFTYTCPACHHTISDYDIWWKQDDVIRGMIHEFECEECKKKLSLNYNFAEYCFLVSIF